MAAIRRWVPVDAGSSHQLKIRGGGPTVDQIVMQEKR